MANSTSGDEKVSRALIVDHAMKKSVSDSSQSPSVQFGAELAGQYHDSIVSKYSPEAGRADKHASNIPGPKGAGK